MLRDFLINLKLFQNRDAVLSLSRGFLGITDMSEVLPKYLLTTEIPLDLKRDFLVPLNPITKYFSGSSLSPPIPSRHKLYVRKRAHQGNESRRWSNFVCVVFFTSDHKTEES